ncbi:hypothetical protein JXZ92_02865 [Mycoplasma sp. CSL10137]|uniref:FAD synthase n=1 Tax=unclassified Mycoplasma TaxID=2683645 RepID=UPI00197B33E4|nr:MULTISPECIES: hypothetical protein [unclassified Mycoplasma]MBN4083743.1 hypothetical protein [Mycoplasma sp. CSL10137]MBN4084625.1 hypothetical protein [Mycoplasma sp. CSL10166]MBU4693103.1 hypothetical protein [Mycoplasma sp. CSL7491-lung]
MKNSDLLVYNLNNFETKDNDTFLIGAFESFHLGHYQLYKELIKYEGRKILINFSNLDTKNLFHSDIFYTNKSKYFSISELDFDSIIELNFSEIKNLDGIEFIKKIVQNKKVTFIAGSDFKFGQNAQYKLSDIPFYLKNVEIKNVEIFKLLNTKISSSMIKESLKFGDIDLVNELLVSNYVFNATLKEDLVLDLPLHLMKMESGIYSSFMHINDLVFFTCLYVDYKKEYKLFILDFKENLELNLFYNKEVFVEVLSKIRKISDKNMDKVFEDDLLETKNYFLNKYSNYKK